VTRQHSPGPVPVARRALSSGCIQQYVLLLARAGGVFYRGGARSYIGTLWNIGNATATQAATVFYDSAIGQGNILAAFSAMNRSLTNRKYQDVYILWGLPFSSLRPPDKKSDQKILDRLVETYFLWLRKIATTPLEEVKRNSIPIARFLLSEIRKSFSRERLDEIRDLDPNALDEHERSLRAIPDDDVMASVERRFALQRSGT
jgi:hypothetical protein